jgi:hypothetical protein
MTSHGEAREMRRGHSRPGYHPSVAWRWPLESGLRSKDSRVVRRRVVGKVPIEATRWRPTLLQARFWSSGGRGDSPTDCRKLSDFFTALFSYFYETFMRAHRLPDILILAAWHPSSHAS